jgi:hypothetical protein
MTFHAQDLSAVLSADAISFGFEKPLMLQAANSRVFRPDGLYASSMFNAGPKHDAGFHLHADPR